MSQPSEAITAPVAKIMSAWALVGVTSWAEAASFAAFCYSLILIGEWLWKRIARPLLVARGWVK